MFRPNRLKQRLAAGKKSLGLWLNLGHVGATEAMAQAGYDSLVIDNEHSPGSLEGTQAQLAAICTTPTTSIVRVPWNDPVYLKRVLDIGAESVMIPMVETAEQARVAVAACRYPPRGWRGAGYAIARAADYGARMDDYVRTAHRHLLIILQIESARAVDNIAAIAAVDGVDMLVIGPNDLSGSIGRLAQFAHPEVRRLMARAEANCRKAGIPAGTVPHDGKGYAELFRQGYAWVAASSDIGFLRDGARAEVAAYRKKFGR